MSSSTRPPTAGTARSTWPCCALFGAPGGLERVLAAYAEVHPPADGQAERVALWQLFPLLVHAALFGGGYGAAVDRAARAYA